MTISIICGFVPAFFLAPIAGVWADCYNRKMLIIMSDSLIAISTLILAILFLLGYKMGFMLDRKHRQLTDDELKHICNTYHNWR